MKFKVIKRYIEGLKKAGRKNVDIKDLSEYIKDVDIRYDLLDGDSKDR